MPPGARRKHGNVQDKGVRVVQLAAYPCSSARSAGHAGNPVIGWCWPRSVAFCPGRTGGHSGLIIRGRPEARLRAEVLALRHQPAGDFEHEADHNVEEGVEHDRGVSHRAAASRAGPSRNCDALRGRQSRTNAILISEPTEQQLTIPGVAERFTLRILHNLRRTYGRSDLAQVSRVQGQGQMEAVGGAPSKATWATNSSVRSKVTSSMRSLDHPLALALRQGGIVPGPREVAGKRHSGPLPTS